MRRLRRQAGLTQAELAGTALSESYISLIESGRRAPSGEVIAYLAERLGCDPAQLEGVDHLPDAGEVELLIRRGEWETSSGAAAAAVDHLRAGVDLADQLQLPLLAYRGRLAMAKAFEVDGRMRDAIDAYECLLVEARESPRVAQLAPVVVGLSRCCREMGDLERAVAVGEGFLADLDATTPGEPTVLEDTVLVGATLMAAYIEMGDIARGVALASRLVEVAESADTPRATGAAYWNAALAAEADGRIADALRLAEKAQVSMAETQDVRNRARLQIALGGLHLRSDPPDLDAAFQLLHAAEPVIDQFGSPVDQAYCRTELARANLQAAQFDTARLIATRVLDEMTAESETPIEAARTLMVRANALAKLGNHDAALADTRSAAEMLERVGASLQAASRWTELAELCVEIGDSPGAIEAFRNATELLGTRRTAGSEAPMVAGEAARRQAG